jgi:hypothetical protein
MDKYQYMVITVGAIFCVLLLIGFGVLVNLTFKEKKMAKKMAPCPDYWEEVKDVLVVDVNPNKDFIYKDEGKKLTDPITIGDNAIQQDIIMIDKNFPLLRINNEVTKKITACKVPLSGNINVGNIYDNSSKLKLRNYSYGFKHNNMRNNYTTTDKIQPTGASLNVKYNRKTKIYTLTNPAGIIVNGDTLKSTIPTPGFYEELVWSLLFDLH